MRGWPSRCIVEGVRAVVLIVAMCSVGCVESRYDLAICAVPRVSVEDLPPAQQSLAMQPPLDSFWMQQEIAAMHEPKPLPVRSISLGYIGDTPLTGGVMRNTPMPPRPAYVEYAADQ